MSVLCWNVRGLGNPRAFNRLRKLIRKSSPDMVFLSETRLFGRRAANLKRRLGFDGMAYVDSEGRSGGLALLWRDVLQVRFRSSSCSHIDVDVISDSGDQWQFTGFYGPPKKKARRHAWDLLKRLRSNPEVPWICGGDFNEILSPSEVVGGGERSLNEMWLFREALDWCDLTNMGFVGPKLTWDNR